MKISDVIEAIREFFLDILGYLIPGTVALSFILLFVENVSLDLIFETAEVDPTIVYLILSYCLGYVVYGVALERDRLLKKRKWLDTPSKITRKIQGSLQYRMTIETLKTLWTQSQLVTQSDSGIEALPFNDARSLAMSYIPEADRKIYTFMFRAELCNHLNVLLSLLSIIGLISCVLATMFPYVELLKTDKGHIIFYIVSLVLSIFLHKTRVRFLSIAYNIPFTIFVAKYYSIDKSKIDAQA